MNSRPGDISGSGEAPFNGVAVGTAFGPVRYDVSEAANDRYWEAAGISHSARAAGVLFPPMAANLTILAFQTVAPDPLLHTAQRIECRAVAHAPTSVTVSGSVTDRFERRGREYVEVTTTTADARGTELWISVATFVEAGA